jgi:hypothetical protein
MTPEEIHQRLQNDPDFVYAKRYGYSLKRLMERYTDGCPDQVIAQVLLISEEEVEQVYGDAVTRLRNTMNILDS